MANQLKVGVVNAFTYFCIVDGPRGGSPGHWASTGERLRGTRGCPGTGQNQPGRFPGLRGQPR